MSFNVTENTTFVNIRLTDEGRRSLSLGRLNFKKAVISDREVDYGVDRTGYYNILNNRILSPAFLQPGIEPINLDGSPAMELSQQQVVSAKQFITGETSTFGFFSGDTDSWTILTTNYVKGTRLVTYNQTWNSTGLTLDSGTYAPIVGDLVMIPWITPEAAGNWQTPLIDSGTPTNCLWYRVVNRVSNTLQLDRPIPNFDTLSSSLKTTAYFYPYNAIDTYYGSGVTQVTSVWNLNICRTHSVGGTDTNFDGVSGYTRYGSLEYSGTKIYFGFGNETPAVGFVHYSNRYTGNTYAEQLIEKSVQVFLPTVMWHHNTESNGKATRWGLSLFDIYGNTFYDSVSKTNYRELRDGASAGNKVVGRVYHSLKLIVITDQELLTILSYKSNRSYSLPEPIVTLTNSPKYPLASNAATGLCKKGYTYFISYVTNTSAYTSSVSFGNPESQHCGYIQKIDGETDINGNPQFLQVTFPPNAFPYMRSTSDLTAMGTGWNANNVQLLINEQPISAGYDVGNVPTTSWKRVSDATVGGNGVYRSIDYSDATIDPLKLNGFNFVISQQDYNSGSTYTIYSGITYGQQSLNYGYESLFYGVVDCQIFVTTYKTIITVYATNSQINSSVNKTFDSLQDANTYITEVAILDDLNNVVAVGKPTSPIKKNTGRFIAFQLEIDY